MNNGKTHSIPIGSLLRDVDQRDIGIIVGPLVEVPYTGARTQLVLWPAHQRRPAPMDLSAIETGWVEVISEAR